MMAVLPASLLASTPLDTLQPQHPRIFLHSADLPRLKEAVASDPFAKMQYEQLRDAGNRLLTVAPGSYRIGGEQDNLLDTSREMEGRIVTLAGLYLITGDKQYAKRATEEILAAAAFPDWHPGHFLDTAEMTAGVGIGYDWLYDTLSPADKTTIEHAIATKGIDAWLAWINTGKAHYRNNWSQVCNGGMTIGALAIAEVEPQRATAVLDFARSEMAFIMQLFAPDGSFEEGPGYWSYATIYNVLYIDALDSALGTDFGATDAPGFSTTPNYLIEATGPTHMLANFGDARPSLIRNPQLFWFARRFHAPLYAEYERNLVLREGPHANAGRFGFFELLWSSLTPLSNNSSTLPTVYAFARVNQAFLRSAWDDPNAWYVGLKGGYANTNHGHLDLGSFVFDALGERWAIDLGPDNYGLPGYFDTKARRWQYYRMRTESHNTLLVDGQNESLTAKVPIVFTSDEPGAKRVIADLAQAYPDQLAAWKRGIALFGDRRLLVQDEVVANRPVEILWNFLTGAKVHILPDGRTAQLSLNGKTIYARIVEPEAAEFETLSAQAPPPQFRNDGVIDLAVRIKQLAGARTISVLFSESTTANVDKTVPLGSWTTRQP